MKITKLETMHVKPRWMFLKVYTDEGIIGYGEPVVEGRARTVEMAVKELESVLIGQDPRNIEHLWQTMYRGPFYRGGPILVSAISGIEQALWDIKGKYHNMPVYEMLGGACRSKIRMYGWARGEDVKTLVASALDRKKRGFTAIKYAIDAPNLPIMNEADADRHVEKIAALREAVGKEIDIGVDFHGRLSPANAIRLARKFEPYYPMFIEEPCLPENVDTMVTIARSTSIPIASGERLFTKWGFRELLEKQAVAIIQPDICHAGGILEARKIAAMSEVYYGSVAPHNPLGPIALSACLQLDASIPNFLIQEHPTLDTGEDRGVGIFKNPLVVKDGYIDIPKLPGLGFEFDEEALQDKLYDGSWQIPMLHHADGSMADW
jgi:galactonate dehydratase